MTLKLTTTSGAKQVVNIGTLEASLITSLLWDLYAKSNDPKLGRAHLILSCLFHGKVEIENEVNSDLDLQVQLRAYLSMRVMLKEFFCRATRTKNFGACSDDENQFAKWLTKKGYAAFIDFDSEHDYL